MSEDNVLGFIHRFVPARGPDEPTLLLLHGTGGNEDTLLELGRMLMPQAALLSPRGQVLEHGMPRFFRRLAEGIFDVGGPDPADSRPGRASSGRRRTPTASTRAASIAVGFSNGANIAASLLLLRPEVLSHAILFRADGAAGTGPAARSVPCLRVDRRRPPRPSGFRGEHRAAGARPAGCRRAGGAALAPRRSRADAGRGPGRRRVAPSRRAVSRAKDRLALSCDRFHSPNRRSLL